MARTTTGDSEAGKASRLSLPLTNDGLIDWEHVRGSTAEKVLYVVQNDPEIAKFAKGEDGADVADVFGGLTAENVSKGLDALCTVNAMVFRVGAAKFIKHPLLKTADGKPVPLFFDQDILDKSFGLTEKQHAELDPRATRLAQKYSGKMPAWLKDNLDLYMFASMFLAYTAENARNVMSAQLNRDLHRAQTAFATAKANQSKNPQPDTDAVKTVSNVPQPSNGHAQPIDDALYPQAGRDFGGAAPESPTA
jgi:hypothetical protein